MNRIKYLITSAFMLFSMNAMAIYPNGVTNLFCWDYGDGQTEFNVKLLPHEHISIDWTYGPRSIDMDVSVGRLAHEAIDLPMWRVDQMGGLMYAKRESKRVRRTPPLEQSSMIDILWLAPYGEDVLFVNFLDIDDQLDVSYDYALRQYRENGTYTKVMIFASNLNYTRYRNNPDGDDIEIASGFCEERW